MNPIHELFNNLIVYRNADDSVMQQAYQFACKNNDVKLLETLARSAPLGSDIDKLIEDRTELSVLKIWASRAGRPVDDVSKRFAKESRSTLLLDLAGLEDMPEKFYEDLAKRKSIHLAWKLIGNPSVPYSLKEKLAVSLGKNTNVTNRSIWDRMRPLAQLDSDLVVIFLENNSNEKALRVLTEFVSERSGVSVTWTDSEKSVIMTKIFDTLSRIVNTNPSYYASWELRNLTSSLFNYGGYTDEDLDSIHTKLKSLIDSLDQDSDLYSVFASINRTIAKRRETDFDKILEEVALAKTPADIQSAVQNYRTVCYNLNTSCDMEAVGRIVLANTNIDAVILRSYSNSLDTEVAQTIAERALNNKDAELCGEVFYRSFVSLGFDLFSKFFGKAEDPEGFVYFLLGESGSAPYYMTSSKAFGENVDLALKFLPALTVLRSAQYAAKVSEILKESLGEDQQAWDTFTALAGEWSGSFNDLIQVSGTLTPS